MLSRVAERLCWYGRYCERIENTARMINVYSNVLLDLPGGIRHIWRDLLTITGSSDQFHQRYRNASERNVLRFMLVEPRNPGSLLCSVIAARENARTTREIFPSEVWEKINQLYHYVRTQSDDALNAKTRHRFLGEVITACNQITGLLYGVLSRGNAWNFINIGLNLERADMTTRIVDTGCINLLQQRDDIPDAFDDILWMNVLRSLSAYQMFRQHVRDRVNGEDVVDFLIKDAQFPRSVSHCLGELEECFVRLPGHDLPLRELNHTKRVVNNVDTAGLLRSGLHDFIDEIQVDLAELHNFVGQTWFGYSGSSQTQSAGTAIESPAQG